MRQPACGVSPDQLAAQEGNARLARQTTGAKTHYADFAARARVVSRALEASAGLSRGASEFTSTFTCAGRRGLRVQLYSCKA
jgi:hypothetical protein